MDPKTGEILGMANLPTFNPNQYWDFKDQNSFINRAVASQYEPGSTFKIVTVGAAVDENLFKPNESLNQVRSMCRAEHFMTTTVWVGERILRV